MVVCISNFSSRRGQAELQGSLVTQPNIFIEPETKVKDQLKNKMEGS